MRVKVHGPRGAEQNDQLATRQVREHRTPPLSRTHMTSFPVKTPVRFLGYPQTGTSSKFLTFLSLASFVESATAEPEF